MITKDLGVVTAYGYAVSKGYTGTEEEFAELMASYATVAESAAQSAQTATEKAQAAAQAVLEAVSAKNGAVQAKSDAERARDSAAGSATAASQSASSASGSASSASQSASSAQTSAESAAGSANSASQSATDANTAKTDAQTAKADAETAKDEAETAQAKAEEAQGKAEKSADDLGAEVEQIETNKNDIANLKSAIDDLTAHVDRKAGALIDTASGAVASFVPDASVENLLGLTVDIEPVQAGSGDPSPDNVRPISGRTECVIVDDPIYGGYIEWNQLANNFIVYDSSSGTVVKDGNKYTYTFKALSSNQFINTMRSANTFNSISGHKFLEVFDVFCTKAFKLSIGTMMDRWAYQDVTANIKQRKSLIVTGNGTTPYLYIGAAMNNANTFAVGDSFEISNIQLFDLTQMFGAGNEPTTVDEFKALFPLEYYAYNGGTKTNVSAVNGTEYKSYTTALGRTVYGGTLDVTTGVLTVDTVSTTISSGRVGGVITQLTNTTRFLLLDVLVPGWYNRFIKCDRLNRNYYGEDAVGFSHGDDSANVFIKLDKSLGLTTAELIYEWLSNNPLQFVYKLATPTTYQLTPTEVKTLLGANNIFADTGAVDVEYCADTKKYIDNAIATAIAAL